MNPDAPVEPPCPAYVTLAGQLAPVYCEHPTSHSDEPESLHAGRTFGINRAGRRALITLIWHGPK